MNIITNYSLQCSGMQDIKDWYLNMLHGTRGEERYENYVVFYRRAIDRFTIRMGFPGIILAVRVEK